MNRMTQYGLIPVPNAPLSRKLIRHRNPAFRRQHPRQRHPRSFEVAPTVIDATLHGWPDNTYGADGLGFSFGKTLRKLGRGIKKVVRSKAFKIAAIGATAYFAGPALLAKFGARKGLVSAIGRGLGRAVKGASKGAGGIAKSYFEAQALPANTYPDQGGFTPSYQGTPGYASPFGGGGSFAPGGGESSYDQGGGEGAAPGEGGEAPAQSQLAGFSMGPALLIGGGLIAAYIAMRPRRRRR